MSEPLADVDLDALAPRPKTAKLGGKIWKLPGDMPMPLFLRIQAYDQRLKAGEAEIVMLAEIQDELLALFQVHHPELKKLPAEMGVGALVQSLGVIYGPADGGAVGEPPPNRATRRQPKRKTPSSTARKPAAGSKATSR